MDAGICLEAAVQSVRPAQTAQTNMTKTDESSGTEGFQELLTQCGKEQTASATKTPQEEQQPAEQPEDSQQQTPEQLEALAQLAMTTCFPQMSSPIVENPEPTAETANVAGVELLQAAGVSAAGETTGASEDPQLQQTTELVQSEAIQPEDSSTRTQAVAQTTASEESLLQQGESQTGEQSSSQNIPDATVVSSSWNTALFGELEQAPVRVGDAPVDMAQPAQQVEQQLNVRLQSALKNGSEQLTIQLNPADLGTVVAKFTSSPEGVLHVVLHAESEQTARLLQEHAPALGLLLQENTHGEVQVQVTQPQQEQTAWQQDAQSGGGQQQQQQNRRSPNREESESFLHQLRLGLVEQSIESV